MIPSPRQLLLCLATFLACLWGLAMLQAAGSETVGSREARGSGRNSLGGKVPGRIRFDYSDFEGIRHEFECRIDPSFSQGEQRSFGYPANEEANLAALDERLKETIRKSLGPFARYADLGVTHEKAASSDSRLRWTPTLTHFRWRAELPDLFVEEADRARDRVWTRGAVSAFVAATYRQYLGEHGFTLTPGGKGAAEPEIAIDYKRIADRARPWLRDCYDRFLRQSQPRDDEELLAQLVAAFQSLSFDLNRLPPLEEEGRYKMGFWTPTQVLEGGRGDCDSNATTFCSLWQSPGLEILLFSESLPEWVREKVPPGVDKHVLLGFDGYPGVDQKFVQVGLRRYVLFEVVRPSGLNPLPLGQLFLDLSPTPKRGMCMTGRCFSAP